MKYQFKYRGSLTGKFAFEIDSLSGLKDKVRSLKNSGGISAGAIDIEQLGAVRPADDETMVQASDYDGAGWYVVNFDGSSEKFDTEAEALVSFIEDRTETRAE